MKLNQDSCKIYRIIDHLKFPEEETRPTVKVIMEFSKTTFYSQKHLPMLVCLRLFIIVSNQQAEDQTHQEAKTDKCHTLTEGINTAVAAAVELKELSKE